MNVKIFCHSLVSDWNHGNAHFLRGITSELIARGHRVEVFEPSNAWSVKNLIEDRGQSAIDEFHERYPTLHSASYDLEAIDLDDFLRNADLVLVHEWSDRELVRQIGEHHSRQPSYRLLFHDTHHRSVTQPDEMSGYELTSYDGVLAFGDVIRDLYLANGWARQAWTWHEAADTRMFYPLEGVDKVGDLVWVGNWGDDERAEELEEFLLKPVRDLGLKAAIYGVRYPEKALKALKSSGVEYMGSLANYDAPTVFAKYRFTVHVPRRPYARSLPGIPTIRIFEALACGIPLVSAPWRDSENLFTPGQDFATASSGEEMTRILKSFMDNPYAAKEIADHGLKTVRARHTCSHRVDELLAIAHGIEAAPVGGTR